MAKLVSESAYLKAMATKLEYEKQLQVKSDGRAEMESLKAVVTFIKQPLAMVLEMKERYPKHSKSWITNKLLNELHTLRQTNKDKTDGAN